MASVNGLEQYGFTNLNILVSFYKSPAKVTKPPFCKNLFMDSGAYSAFRQGVSLDPLKYAEFIKANKKQIFVYAGMDVIGDPEATWKNQLLLEKNGIMPLPTFHLGEDFKWLKKYASKYDYIAVGGAAIFGQNKHLLYSYFDNCWKVILQTNPKVKVHGFGLQNEKLMTRYPWYSVDASSVHMVARYGGIFTPWGIIKINPSVESQYQRWKSPKRIQLLKEWVNGLDLGFTYDEALESSTPCVLKRCAISVHYFETKYENYEFKNQINFVKTLF